MASRTIPIMNVPKYTPHQPINNETGPHLLFTSRVFLPQTRTYFHVIRSNHRSNKIPPESTALKGIFEERVTKGDLLSGELSLYFELWLRWGE